MNWISEDFCFLLGALGVLGAFLASRAPNE